MRRSAGRDCGGRGRRLEAVKATPAPSRRTAPPAATRWTPSLITATGSSVISGGARMISVSVPRSLGRRAQRTATTSRPTGESTVHQNSVVMVTAANEPGVMSMGMLASVPVGTPQG